MTELSPEAVEVQAPPDLEFPELARPVKAEGMQYAGLTPVERALAEDDLHMSTCDEPSIDGCGDCQRKLARFRRLIEVVSPAIEADARADERRKVIDEMAEQIADEIQALLADSGALFEWLANHGLADASPGATLAAYLRDLKGTCSACFAPPVAAASDPTDTRPEGE